MIKSLKWLSIVATLGMTFVLLGGALVTKTGSEDGCGNSWPLCEGEWLPSEITPELIIELSHRLVTGVVGFAVIGLAILAWIKLGHVREVKFLSILSVLFLILQALIGAAAVVWGQSDFALAAHFGISLISFAAVFLLMLLIFEVDKKFDAKSLLIKKAHRLEIYALTIYTMLVVYSGALVRHTDANLVCKSWPFCNNQAPLDFSNYVIPQWIQMGHRLAAGILFLWTVIFAFRMIRTYKNNKLMFWGWWTVISLITLQVFFGAMIIFTRLHLATALMHALIISLFFGMLTYFILHATRSAKYAKQTDNNKSATQISS
ncbi:MULTISPECIES: COX15/CtaA family protein [Virgibacillus]|uniref:Heme A synthase n=1 Tax=Virgibacillus dokdonensis TaxID=302167 RepID=A0A2K9J4L6_9BACI|nr:MULTISPECIES: heme A synthase [Virgibacillus]AUJ26806.1 Heme A synthase [Virgibacillus dokdonensis]NWO12756.1 heme A synthase [Virgibacillus sp.]